MISYLVFTQQGHEAQQLQTDLTERLLGIAETSFGAPSAQSEVAWTILPKDYAWTGGQPSNSSVVVCRVPEDIAFDRRASFIKPVNDVWIDKTGADPSELLIVTTSRSL